MKKCFIATLLAAQIAGHMPAAAEDIDLFAGVPPGAAEVPNVLVILDNTANWDAAFDNEMAALSKVLGTLPPERFRVGLMMFGETGADNSNVAGGYVRAAVRLLDSDNQTRYAALIDSLDKNADQSARGSLAMTMAEAYFYFSGLAPHSGNNKDRTDYRGNSSGSSRSNAVYALSGNALLSKAGSPYVSPVTSACARNFIVYISNSALHDNVIDNSLASAQLAAAGGSTIAIPLSPADAQDNIADEWARWMKQDALGLTTYTIDVNRASDGNGPGWSALLRSMAAVSGGKYFDVAASGTAIADALNVAFGEIQAVNSVFASPSLPASAHTRSTLLNEVFIGMFRPDENGLSRWLGNLKHYKIGLLDGSPRLLDSRDEPALDSGTGFMTGCARSFWTPATTDTYWAFSPSGSCLAVSGSDASNSPDGPVVEKGAQAHVLRSAVTRDVHTCSADFDSCTALTSFDTSNSEITGELLGAASLAEKEALIDWARGLDNFDEDIDGITTAEMRPSLHGDVVHSRPLAIDFGSDTSPRVVVFYGGNDGMLRAINGNRGTDIGPVGPGGELWSFMAPEFYGKIKRIRDNTIAIDYPGSSVPGAQPKAYGMDGPITAFQGAIAGIAKVFVYAGMRRGGRALYAFDVSAPSTPALMWKVGCPAIGDDSGCTVSGALDFSGIGQTWSPAVTMHAAGHGSGTSALLMMGGGYDDCEDVDSGMANHDCATPKGNKIYVLDAETGALLKVMDTERSVAGGITVVPDAVSGLARYAYAADTGGNLYRIGGVGAGGSATSPFGESAPADWTITRVASLGCATSASCAANRKFLFAPDVVEDRGSFMILVGSGDREKPLLRYAATAGVKNYFFAVRDTPANTSWLSEESSGGGACGVDLLCLGSLTPVLSSATPGNSDLAAGKGWYLGLAATEQVVTAAITVSNRVTFSTSQPPAPVAGSCGSGLGTANVYNVNYLNAAPLTGEERFEHLTGDGLPPSPVAGSVTLDDGTTVPILIGGSASSPFEVMDPSVTTSFDQPTTRVYWHIEQ
ncbi:MAG: pilus assembly protein PilY [Gammaproteobacteria bacterium]|nr:pilus assembly protein PilY [Gammaproteobacteria bacterium]